MAAIFGQFPANLRFSGARMGTPFTLFNQVHEYNTFMGRHDAHEYTSYIGTSGT